MTSRALIRWQTDRARRIDQLIDAHSSIGGVGPGRRWRTEQLNWALMLRLAAEFQGYARDLHDESVDFFVASAAPANPALEQQLRILLTRNRKLDSGNANPSSLGVDFGSLGMLLWNDLRAANGWSGNRHSHLERLNSARNAIAHDMSAELAVLRSEGYPCTLKTIDRSRSALEGLAMTMDETVGSYLASLFGAASPW